MIYPNKHIRFEESIIYKMLTIMDYRSYSSIGLLDLFNNTKRDFENIDEFIISLDVLYALDMIEVDFKNEVVTYVK